MGRASRFVFEFASKSKGSWVWRPKPLEPPSRSGVPLSVTSDAGGELFAEVATNLRQLVLARLYQGPADRPRRQKVVERVGMAAS